MMIFLIEENHLYVQGEILSKSKDKILTWKSLATRFYEI